MYVYIMKTECIELFKPKHGVKKFCNALEKQIRIKTKIIIYVINIFFYC